MPNHTLNVFPSGEVQLEKVGYRPEFAFGFKEVKTAYVDNFWAWALGFKASELSKQGYGRSHISAAKLVERMNGYANPGSWTPDPKVLARAISHARMAFRIPKIRRHRVHQVPFKSGSAAGLGYRGKKGEHGNHLIACDRARKVISSRHSCKVPCMMATRGHFGTPDDPKTRLVWAYPFEMTLIEGMYAEPLIRAYLQHQSSPMTVGRSSLKIAADMHECMQRGTPYGLDFSKFDSSIRAELIYAAFDILFEQFEEVAPVHRKIIVDYFINTPLALPDGVIVRKRKGVPSGSYFTQMIDSVVNYIAVWYMVLRQNPASRPLNLQVLGDDSMFAVRGKLDKHAAVNAASELGLTLNMEKTFWGHDSSSGHLTYLGHHVKGGILTRPLEETIERLLFVETNKKTTPSESAERGLGHYIDSAGQLPLKKVLEVLNFEYWVTLKGYQSFDWQYKPIHKIGKSYRTTGFEEWIGTFIPRVKFDESLLIVH